MLDPALVEQLRGYLGRLTAPIELVSSVDDSPASTEMVELLDELAGLSPLITHVRGGTDPRRPSFRIVRTGTDVEVAFAGIPLGHEFTSLVLALLQVGGHPSTEDPALLDQVRAIRGEHHFETYFSLSCQKCPDVVQALNLMSILNPGITHTAIDGALFPAEVEERGVLAVPMVYRNGEHFGQGRMSLGELVAMLGTGADGAAAALTEAAPYEVLVVGGGPAGATAAMYAARKGIRTGLVAERFGGQLNDTVTIENYPSVAHTEGPAMAADLESQVRGYGVDLMLRQRASRLVPARVPGGLHSLELAGGATLRARTVIVAAGARWRTLGVPGEQEYLTKGVTFCPHCDGPLFAGKRVAVVGGGNSGIEAAIDLAGIVGHVTVVEFLDSLRADEVLQDKLRSLPNTEVVLGTRTTEVLGDGAKVTGMRLEPREGGAPRVLDVDGIFVQIGLLPSTEWVADELACSERKEIVIDDRGATDVPGVFAAGDCTTVPFKQIAVAGGAGAIAALSAFDYLIRTPAAEPTAVAAATV